MNRKFQKDSESTSEYILPDYLGDVKKLLLTTARVIPSGQFESEGETECAGIVAYDVVYLDSENKLSAANFTSDYDFNFTKDSESYIDSYVTSQIANYGVRLTGPRRMIAKANVQSEVYLMEKWEPAVSGTAFNLGENPEKTTETVSIESALKGEAVEREYAEEIASLESVSADEIEVISSSAYVRISESVPVEDGVNIKGELIVTAIVRTPDTSVFAIRREIPFDETVSISGVVSDMSAISDVVVSSVSIGINEGENSTELVANVITDISAIAFSNESVELVTDAYLKTKDTIAEYENLNFSSFMASETKSGNVNLKIPISELENKNLKEIIALNQDFRSLSFESDGKTSKFSGEVSFSGVACEISEEGESYICNLKFSVPVDINVNISCQNGEKTKLSAKISPAGCEWDIDGENLNIKLWYTLTYTTTEEENCKYLSSCNVTGDAEYKKSLSCINVYYPDENESLFEIAKKFHTSVKDIAADNMISEAAAQGIPLKAGFKKLIIR